MALLYVGKNSPGIIRDSEHASASKKSHVSSHRPPSYQDGQQRVVGIVGFEGVTPLDIAGPLEAFSKARSRDDQPFYRAIIIGVTTKKFVSESGLILTAQHILADAPELDILVIPGGRGIYRVETRAEIAKWIRERAKATSRFVSICGGLYALAATGLLINRTATTHWRVAYDLARRFPEVQINYAASFLKDGRYYSCASSTAAIELALSIIEEDCGPTVALSVAKELVVQLRPPGDIEGVELRIPDESEYIDRLNDMPAWIAAHLRENLSVEALAHRACLCPRHFGRLFKAKFGVTPGDFVESLRLSEARRRLLTSQRGLENVAAAVGFKSADSFRRAFERRVGMAPSRFRRIGRLRSRDLHRETSVPKKRAFVQPTIGSQEVDPIAWLQMSPEHVLR